jgi:hypothetical protein
VVTTSLHHHGNVVRRPTGLRPILPVRRHLTPPDATGTRCMSRPGSGYDIARRGIRGCPRFWLRPLFMTSQRQGPGS